MPFEGFGPRPPAPQASRSTSARGIRGLSSPQVPDWLKKRAVPYVSHGEPVLHDTGSDEEISLEIAKSGVDDNRDHGLARAEAPGQLQRGEDIGAGRHSAQYAGAHCQVSRG